MNPPSDEFVNEMAALYLRNDYSMRLLMGRILSSPEFRDEGNFFTKYSWPAEFIARALKEVGWTGFSVNDAITPMLNMGQVLFEPPDVAGWEQGPGWISTGGMLARMNFAAALAKVQATALATWAKPISRTADAVLSGFVERLAPSPFDNAAYNDLRSYLLASGAWTGSDAQLRTKAPGLVHLIVGSAEYVFV
ncbi:MAG: DUF1800 family protein, partial [Acidobacteria bacterium]|nr:DUF1800 family protein [Acidobacteriota bacterium]